jgi:hypothetical protein
MVSANGLKSKPKPKEGETDEPTRWLCSHSA